MAAAYPTSVKTFADKTDGDIVEAADPNVVYDEVTAIETALLSSGLAHLVRATGLRFTNASTLTIAAGGIAANLFRHDVDTEGASGADDLDTVNLGSVTNGIALGQESLVLLTPANVARVVTVKHLTGNLTLANGSDYVMNDAGSAILLRRNGASGWTEVARSGGSVGAPASFAPSWGASSGSTPTLGNGTLTGRYLQIGKLVTAWIDLVFGSTTNGETGIWTFSLPVTATSALGTALGDANILQSAGPIWKLGGAVLLTSGLLRPLYDGVLGVTASNVITFAVGDELHVIVQYVA